jgi:hypothetical protein
MIILAITLVYLLGYALSLWWYSHDCLTSWQKITVFDIVFMLLLWWFILPVVLYTVAEESKLKKTVSQAWSRFWNYKPFDSKESK